MLNIAVFSIIKLILDVNDQKYFTIMHIINLSLLLLLLLFDINCRFRRFHIQIML